MTKINCQSWWIKAIFWELQKEEIRKVWLFTSADPKSDYLKNKEYKYEEKDMEKSNELVGKFKIKNHKLIVEPSVFKKLEIVDRNQIISEEGTDGIKGFYYNYYDHMFIAKEDIDLSQVLTEYASFLDDVNNTLEKQKDHRNFLWVPSIKRNMYFKKDKAVHFILCSSPEQVERYFYQVDRFHRMCQEYRFHLLVGSWLEHYDYLDGKEYKVDVLWGPGSVDDAATYGYVTREPVVQETDNANNEKKGFFRRLIKRIFSYYKLLKKIDRLQRRDRNKVFFSGGRFFVLVACYQRVST